ncbi:ROK family transcriptional regulator [Vibrio sp. SS-MA-C1-2]|uniref:DNA-binding transcriptional regulator NagC n=1 Tax=Vibrio sp. SS-MA-C1-2 TaxID=2908646 RepID=UPI001F3E3D2E|nr:ROK family protein [Vibrio sp. SS-MA-C1-2]UJF18670.1 ROK family transcriptional regulator [Vibrio sp. SS-MA-C1-2]
MATEKIGNIDLVKQLNSAVVYRLIDRKGPISRIQIAEISQLAPASITKITRQLIERGLIKEVAQQASTGGRRPISLTCEYQPFQAIAIRIGRDNIELSLYDLSGHELANMKADFPYTSQDSLVKGLINHITAFIAKNNTIITELLAIGISLPGLLDPDTGRVSYIPNIEVEDLHLTEIIELQFKISCFIGNDIRSLALAEHYFGVSTDVQDSIVISVHNGTGAGIMVNGSIFLGHNRNVGEIGHIQVDPLGEHCQCGNFGCLETVASNPALINHVKTRMAQGYPSILQDKEQITVKDICEAALNYDELAKQAILQLGNHLGKVIAMTINLFNPEKIIIAGDITQAKQVLFPIIQRCIDSQSLPTFRQELPIVESTLFHQPTIGAFATIKRSMLDGILLQRILEKK